MNKLAKILLVTLLCLIGPAMFAQNNGHYTDQAWRFISGFPSYPAQGATITVCAFPNANIPCAPLATIYGGPTTASPHSNPFTADNSGNYDFWAQPGTYVVTVTGNNINSYSRTVTIPCVVTQPCGGGSSGSSGVVQAADGSSHFQTTGITDNGTSIVVSKQLVNSSTILVTGATPSVSSGNVFRTNNGGATTITNFSGGVDSQVITVTCGDTNTTIQNNGNISLFSGSNFICSLNSSVSFVFSGGIWVQTATSSGGGSAPVAPLNSLQKNNNGVLGASSLTDNGITLTSGENHSFKGPNPYADITAYGARPCNINQTPCTLGLTASCVSGQPSVTISSASTFVNGDGVVLYGCGGANSLTTPSAPTITPSNSRMGTGTGDVVNAPTGATTFNYKVLACDKSGGCTPVSATGSTSTGNALGAKNLSITSATRSNDTLTFNTPSQPGVGVGAIVHTDGFSVGDNALGFGGWWIVATVTGTGFTVTSTGLDTRNGAPTASAGGGTLNWWNCNHVTWTSVTGTFFYVIQSDRQNPGTFVNIGMSWPVNPLSSGFPDGTLLFDDFGQTMMAQSVNTIPAWVPTNGLATNDYLSTTITSGAGTTSLTLAASAGNTISGTPIRLDATPAILAAANASAGAVKIPIPSSGSLQFVVNSFLDLSTHNAVLYVPGSLVLNATMFLSGGPNITGELVSGTATSFEPASVPQISSTVSPAILFNDSQGSGRFTHIQISGPTNGIAMLKDGGGGQFGPTFDFVNFTSGASSSDFMGTAFICRGNTSPPDSCPSQMGTVLFICGSQSMTDASFTPCGFWDYNGESSIEHLMGSGRPMMIHPNGDVFSIGHSHWQGGTAPLLSVADNNLISPSSIVMGNSGVIELDTMAEAGFFNAALSHTGGSTLTCGAGGCGSPSSSVLQLTGSRGSVFQASPNSIQSNGLNRNSVSFLGGSVADGGIFSPNTTTTVDYTSFYHNAAVVAGQAFPIFIDQAPMAPPTGVVAAGGSIGVGPHTYRIAPVWQNSAIGQLSAVSATITTTPGNQTINLSWTPVSGACKGYNIYRDNTSLTNSAPTVSGCSSNSFSDTIAFPAGGGQGTLGIAGGGPTMLMPGVQGIATPALTLNAFPVAASISGLAVADIAPGSNGQCVVTSSSATIWGSCAGTAGTQTVYNTTQSASNAGIASQTMVASAAANQNYIFTTYVSTTTGAVGCSPSPAFQVVINYTDPFTSTNQIFNLPLTLGTSATQSTSNTFNNGATSVWFGTISFRAKTATSISYSVNFQAGTGCSTNPSYSIAPDLVQE